MAVPTLPDNIERSNCEMYYNSYIEHNTTGNIFCTFLIKFCPQWISGPRFSRKTHYYK